MHTEYSSRAERRRGAVAAPLVLDRTSPVPLYHQIFTQLSDAISAGVLKPGDLLESEWAMADRVQLSRPTVRHALNELSARGLIVRRKGVGTMVARQALNPCDELAKVFDDASDDESATTLIEFSRRRSDRRASEALGLSPDASLIYLERLRWHHDAPVAVLRNWLSPKLEAISTEELAVDGLYRSFRRHHVVPDRAQQSIASRSATAAERSLLRLGRGEPVLTVSRSTFDTSGAPIEVGEHTYRFDACRYDVAVYAS